jgi:hypothetical protein
VAKQAQSFLVFHCTAVRLKPDPGNQSGRTISINIVHMWPVTHRPDQHQKLALSKYLLRPEQVVNAVTAGTDCTTFILHVTLELFILTVTIHGDLPCCGAAIPIRYHVEARLTLLRVMDNIGSEKDR